MVDTLWQDLRSGVRVLLKNPGFAAVAVLSIGIGVGANAAMFSVADTLVLRPLAVPQPDAIVRVMAVTTRVGFQSPTASVVSYPDYVDLRDRARTFTDLAAYRLIVAGFTKQKDQQAQRKFGLAASGNLFTMLGVQPALGRFFGPEEDRVAGAAVVVLDHDTWTRDFGADPGVVGRFTRVGGVDVTVIGVTRPEFTGPDQLLRPGFYVPLAMLTSLAGGVPTDELTRRDLRNLEVKGRLQAGVSMTHASEDVRLIAASLEQSYPTTNRSQGFTVRTEVDGRVAQRPALAVLAAMLVTLAVAVMLVACANVAGLLASRAPVRTRELAVRLAVGAGRVRLVRQLVVEGLVLSSAGGLAGLGLGYAVLSVFNRIELTTDVPLNLSFELDGRALAVGMAAAIVAGLLSSLLPAWRSARLDVVSGLTALPSAASGSRLWGRNLLVCGQLALSLVLLTVAVFLYRAFSAEIDRGPGFRTNGVLMATFYPDLSGYDRSRTDAFYRLLTERARALPGVQSVTLTSTVPLDANSVENTLIAPEGFQLPAGTEHVRILATRIDEGYFETLGLPIVSGRAFQSSDTASTPRVAIVNQTLAAHYWPGANAIGKRFRLNDADATRVEIVGVAADAKYRTLSEAPTEFVYYPRLQGGATNRGASFEGTLLVAMSTNAADVVAPLRDMVRTIDAGMPMFDVRTMASFYGTGTLNLSYMIVRTVGAMGSVGLLLAMVGLYGLVAYSVGRRTREIGLRMAVGAAPGAVMRMVLRHGLMLAAAGIVVGLAGSLATASLLRAAFPFPKAPSVDVATYAVVVAALLVVTLLAAYAPARRASHIDPLKALRTE